MSCCPRARQEGLIVSAAGDETIVYDGKTDKVYLLNATSAAVWNASNGERSAAALASYLSVKTPVTERVVWYALGQLQDLLEEPVTLPHEIAGVSRRNFLKLSGVVAAGVTLPSVVRMVAPPVASAQSAGLICCVCIQDGSDSLQPSCDDCTAHCLETSGSDLALCPAPGAACA